MYTGLLHTHSLLRYFVLIALVVMIIKALLGLVNKQPFGKWDNKISLYLLIFTHLQFLTGLILYFVSPFVKFGPDTMSNKFTRYWTVEHVFGMLIAVALITAARTTSKRMTDDVAKHKRLLIFNLIALIIIVGVVVMSGRRVV